MLLRLNSRRTVVAGLAGAAVAISVGTALASSLPTLYCNLKQHGTDANPYFAPVFSVRPRRVGVLNTQQGGELTLKWSSWTASTATGSGTALPGIAVGPGQKQPTYRVAVKAYRGHQRSLHSYDDHDDLLQHVYTRRAPLRSQRANTSSGGQFNWVASN